MNCSKKCTIDIHSKHIVSPYGLFQTPVVYLMKVISDTRCVPNEGYFRHPLCT
jgi:hypothetical protein